MGVEVYQTTLPSALALATSTESCANAGVRKPATAKQATAVRLSASIAYPPFPVAGISLPSRLCESRDDVDMRAPDANTTAPHPRYTGSGCEKKLSSK